MQPDEIDTGALILTALRSGGAMLAPSASCSPAEPASSLRSAPATVWNRDGGLRFGAVSRAVRDNTAVMNVDIGGGTSKIAVCAEGKVSI